MGPRRRMTSAIARWHTNAPIRSDIECAYSDKLVGEVQDLKNKLIKMSSELKQAKIEVCLILFIFT